MPVLDRKLWRDLWRMRINVVAIVLVLGCGVAILVMAVGMRESLERTRLEYYAAHKMADLAVTLVRAPNRVAVELEAVPHIAAIEPRVAGLALLDLPHIKEPAAARLVSLPRTGRPKVNDLSLAQGRWPDPNRPDEALVNQALATANNFQLGQSLNVTLHGLKQQLKIVGVANSPEFVFVSAPGEIFPQQDRFGVLWMGEASLARAYDMEGAFNDVVLRLSPGADVNAVKDAVNRILAPYGSAGAYDRTRMPSDRFLTEELGQLATMAAFLPAFFIVIAAFLVNIALTRLIAAERSNIGLLKAFGYTDGSVAAHYAKGALLMSLCGAAVGSFAGWALGRLMAEVYKNYYHFPRLEYEASIGVYVAAWSVAVACAMAGALAAVLVAVRLAPAAALAPPPPTSFENNGGLLKAVSNRLDAKSRIVLRRIVRFPRRSATTVVGIALGMSVLVLAGAFPAVMERLLDVNFSLANRQDASLSFVEAKDEGIIHAVMKLPGVVQVEPSRADRVIFHHAGHSVEEALIGLASGARLSRLVNADLTTIEPPAAGVALARVLADKLEARVGDTLDVEQTTGRNLVFTTKVAVIVDPMIGASGYMELGALARLMREPRRVTGVNVRLDAAAYDRFNAAVKKAPALAAASFVNLAERSMRENFDRSVGTMNLIYMSFAAIMAGGVAFSAARITLAEQERDLATLRVLGFTRLEVSYVLIGELALLGLLAVVPGVITGTLMGEWLMNLFSNDLYSFPYVFNDHGYAVAIGFTLGCVAAAALLVRTGIDRLDMVGVLKARD
ncbi:conserved membrane hypothetical protein [uncultured Defluviicoccus sp.]|uniref:ABC transporter permease n=1 Tax=metagenome TaxID=256318 RepID=A0A380T840_9ZZZZ|nr:conserved membrane hypothetical protein [uncultured Defluviicoccus sp.]